MKHPELTKPQRSRINQVIRYLRRNGSGTCGRIARCEIQNVGSFVAVYIEHRRTDCDQYSPRMIFTAVEIGVHITKRGAMDVVRGAVGLTDYAEHFAFMLRCGMRVKGYKHINSWHVAKKVEKRLAKDRAARQAQ